jgi:hypothetical protein
MTSRFTVGAVGHLFQHPICTGYGKGDLDRFHAPFEQRLGHLDEHLAAGGPDHRDHTAVEHASQSVGLGHLRQSSSGLSLVRRHAKGLTSG